MASFSDRLKTLRKSKNATQAHMAKVLECGERHYQKIEYGEINLTQDNLIKLADFFDVSTDYLLGRTNYWIDKEGTLHTKVPVDILNLDTAELLKKLSTSE